MREPSPASGRHTFGIEGETFVLDGRPFVIRSGEMHYPRVPKPYWRRRMQAMRAMGLNTLCTYVFWNLHEPRPGEFDFTGELDLAEYIRTAAEEGLWTLLRPGPYVCTEWDLGGIPAWLLKDPDMVIRSRDPRFLAASDRYMREVGRQVSGLEVARGGSILMTQVENEYGSYAADHEYMAAIRDSLRNAGFEGPLFTADGPSDGMLTGGTLPDVLPAINFGAGDPEPGFTELARFRQGMPRMCGEYWGGWFDHWRDEHHAVSPDAVAQGIDWMLERGISFSLYMVHGGTTFGFMAGANYSDAYEPDTTSYDTDAPLDECGRPTPKFDAVRAAIARHTSGSEEWPPLPEPPVLAATDPVVFDGAADLAALGVRTEAADHPIGMEALDQAYGTVLYRHVATAPASGRLCGGLVRDYAHARLNGRAVGVLDRRHVDDGIDLTLQPGDVLELLVENLGRINFGSKLPGERKGIIGPVALGGAELLGWTSTSIPLADPGAAAYGPRTGDGPVIWRGLLQIDEPADTFLDTSAWRMGHVWVNGRHLGRYWCEGPQQSLYCPGVWLKQGSNAVLVLDLSGEGPFPMAGVAEPIFFTPSAQAKE